MSDSTAPKKSRAGAVIGVTMLVATVGLPLWFFFIGPQLRHDRLLEHGVRAQGRLLDVEETGTVVNDSPELELTIEFRRTDGTLDTAVTDFVPSLRSLHMFQPGIAVTAAYDAEDPEELTIVELSSSPMQLISSPAPAASSPSVDSLARVADSLRREIERLRRE